MFTVNQLEILLRLRRNSTLEMPQFGLSMSQANVAS